MRTQTRSFWLFCAFFRAAALFALSACGPGGGPPDEALGGSGGDGAGGTASGGKFSNGDGGGADRASGGASTDGAGGAGDDEGELGGAAGSISSEDVDCQEGTFEHDDGSGSICHPWTTCAAGSFVREGGSDTKDVVCELCPAGTFSDVEHSLTCSPCAAGSFSARGAASCRQHEECDWIEVETAAGTPTSDTACAPGSPYRQFGTEQIDEVRGVATGPDGGVYVVGGTRGALGDGALGDEDAFLRLYDASGDIVWTRQFGVVGADRAEQVAVDGLGNVMVVTTVDDERAPGGATSSLHAFDESGETLHAVSVGGDVPCLARRIAVERTGQAFVAGVTPRLDDGVEAGDADICVRKYDTLGALVWARQLGSTAEEGLGGISVLADGRAVVVGFTDGTLGAESAGGRDAFAWTLQPDGADEGIEQFGSSADDAATATAVDQMGFVVVGWTTGDLVVPGAGETDVFVRRYRRSLGQAVLEVTTEQLGTTAAEAPTAVAVAGPRVALVASVLTPNEQGDLQADGRLYVLSRNLPTPLEVSLSTPADDVPTGVAFGPSSRVFVGGTTSGAFVGDNLGQADAFVARL